MPTLDRDHTIATASAPSTGGDIAATASFPSILGTLRVTREINHVK